MTLNETSGYNADTFSCVYHHEPVGAFRTTIYERIPCHIDDTGRTEDHSVSELKCVKLERENDANIECSYMDSHVSNERPLLLERLFTQHTLQWGEFIMQFNMLFERQSFLQIKTTYCTLELFTIFFVLSQMIL